MMVMRVKRERGEKEGEGRQGVRKVENDGEGKGSMKDQGEEGKLSRETLKKEQE